MEDFRMTHEAGHDAGVMKGGGLHFSNRNSGKIEIAVSDSKQKRGISSNRN
jgi:hypothetical protein